MSIRNLEWEILRYNLPLLGLRALVDKNNIETLIFYEEVKVPEQIICKNMKQS